MNFTLYLRYIYMFTGGIGKIVNKQRIACDRILESTCNIVWMLNDSDMTHSRRIAIKLQMKQFEWTNSDEPGTNLERLLNQLGGKWDQFATTQD